MSHDKHTDIDIRCRSVLFASFIFINLKLKDITASELTKGLRTTFMMDPHFVIRLVENKNVGR